MTLTNCYVTLDEIRSRLGGQITETNNAAIETAITSACRMIDVWCGQQFSADAAATARIYRPRSLWAAKTDPIYTTTGLIIQTDSGLDGTYATTWTAAQYELDWFGGDMNDLLGAPYDTIRSLGAVTFPVTGWRQNTLKVTAKWGWATVPQNVAAAARILSVDTWKRKDVPFGISTGTVDFGPLRIGRDAMEQVAKQLRPFVREDRQTGVA